MTRAGQFLAAAFLLLPLGLVEAANPYGIPDEVDAGLREGFHALFNLEFDKAEEKIAALQDHAEAHPMVALAAAVVPWWKLTVEVLERDPQASKPFVKSIERSLRIAERRLQRDRHAEARVAMGTTLGLMSRWSAANRAWLPAYTRGNKSLSHLDRALKQNPRAADAYMTLGTFNYARALISKRMSGKDASGRETDDDRAQTAGLNQLRKAYAEAPYFGQASGLLLAGILANERPLEALPVLEKLREELPRSAFVRIVEVIALYNAGMDDELERAADDLLEKVEEGDYDKFFLPQAHFARALVAFRRAKWKPAGKAFGDAIDSGDETNPYTTWAWLYQGYCYDAMGRREKARTCYEKVLSLKPRFASHEHARDRINRPFTRNEPELKKLEL